MDSQGSSCDQKFVSNEQLFRIEGSDLQQTLHRSIGAITYLNANKQKNTGSGVLISKNLVLTAAHNIYDKILCREHVGFKFYLGANGIVKEYHQIQGWKYPSEYLSSSKKQKLQYDYALLKLKKPVQYNQFLKLSLPCQTCSIKQDQEHYVNIFGYPGSYGNFKSQDKFGQQLILYQYGLARKNRIISIEMSEYKIGYGISTVGGQSGCPVVIDDQIIAIHNGAGREGQQFNVGRVITIDILNNLKKWCKQLKGQEFKIQNKLLCPHNQPIINTFIDSMNLQKLHQRVHRLEEVNSGLQAKVIHLNQLLKQEKDEKEKYRSMWQSSEQERKKYEEMYYKALQMMKKESPQEKIVLFSEQRRQSETEDQSSQK